MTQLDAAVSLHEPQRQSVMAIFFLALRTVRQVGLVQIAIALGFLLSRSPSIALLLVVIPLVGLALFGVAALRWWRYTFCIVDDELHVRRGVVALQTLSVPLDRVQSVSLEQKLIHRPFGLVQVSLETAGTDVAEFTIDAVERRVADALQRAAADHQRKPLARTDTAQFSNGQEQPPPPARPDRVILRHRPGRIAAIALTQMPLTGFAVVAPLIAVADDLGDLVPFGLPSLDDSAIGAWLVWAIPLALLAVVLVSVVLNLVRVILVDWNLTVTSTASGLRRDAGLLSTTSIASSIPRVQRIATKQGVLERLIGLHTVVLHTIGAGNFVIPGCDNNQMEEIRSLALEGSPGISSPSRTVSKQVVFKEVRNTSIVATVVVLALAAPLGWWAPLVFTIIPVVWLTVRRGARLRRWDLSHDAAANRHELLGWSKEDLLLRKVNGTRVSQTLFERKRGLATVTLKTADGSMSIGMITLIEAQAVRDRALYTAETERRSWM